MNRKENENNYAFIDGQNLHLGTTMIDIKRGDTEEDSWKVNLNRFRIYLEEKYNVKKAYYFLGVVNELNNNLYEEIQSAGFILVFRKHNTEMIGKKKGNIDVDLVFSVMEKLYKKENIDSVVLVSGDGDYRLLVDFLIKEGKFKKILFPNKKKSSSLYKIIDIMFKADLSDIGVRRKIQDK